VDDRRAQDLQGAALRRHDGQCHAVFFGGAGAAGGESRRHLHLALCRAARRYFRERDAARRRYLHHLSSIPAIQDRGAGGLDPPSHACRRSSETRRSCRHHAARYHAQALPASADRQGSRGVPCRLEEDRTVDPAADQGRRRMNDQAQPAVAPAAESTPTEDEVRAYLAANPDFLLRNPELLSVLTPPQLQRGNQVVDMQSFMLQRQRNEMEKLQSQHGELIGISRSNMASQARVHGAALAVFGARSFEQLIQTVTTDLAVMLDADVATIAVESAEPMKRQLRNQGVQILK